MPILQPYHLRRLEQRKSKRLTEWVGEKDTRWYPLWLLLKLELEDYQVGLLLELKAGYRAELDGVK